jgi:hypothetical protein
MGGDPHNLSVHCHGTRDFRPPQGCHLSLRWPNPGGVAGMLWDKYPTFVNAELDLYKVYTTVADWGGSESVTEQKKWKSVADALKLAHLPTSASHSIKVRLFRSPVVPQRRSSLFFFFHESSVRYGVFFTPLAPGPTRIDTNHKRVVSKHANEVRLGS